MYPSPGNCRQQSRKMNGTIMSIMLLLLALLVSASSAQPSIRPIDPFVVGVRSALSSSSMLVRSSRAATMITRRGERSQRNSCSCSLGIGGQPVAISAAKAGANVGMNDGCRSRYSYSSVCLSAADGQDVGDSIEGFGDGATEKRRGRRRGLAFGAKPNEEVDNEADSKPRQGVSGSVSAGGAAFPTRRLHFWENMVCGAVSRTVAQTIMHPANTMKTIMQSNRDSASTMTIGNLMRPQNLKLLTRGAGAQFLLSVPHGAVNFAVLEYVRRQMSHVTEREWFSKRVDAQRFGPGLDFLSSAISTICCSVVSTPQMMITDNIMAGTYPNLPAAVSGLAADRGVKGFYSGWWPGLAGKIPSYALTWTFFQQLKEAQLRTFKRPPKDFENSIMGCIASATTVCIMIPLDTIKTRLVTQLNYPNLEPYKGIIDCGTRIAKEEGIVAFYRGLTPRLVSVVPMIGIQFGVYEFMKKVMLTREPGEIPMRKSARARKEEQEKRAEKEREARHHNLEEVVMEVAADDDQPFPAPQFKRWGRKKKSK